MTEPATCPTCRSAIPPDSPEGACPRCMLAAGLAGGGPAVPSAADVEAKLPAFEILSVLGHGGMGVVYKARQKTLDRVVALKVLPNAAAATPGFAERFAREAKAMARLTHPNIVAVHDSGESDGLFWLVMEFVDGVNIREAMRAGRITSKEALAIVPQICDALQYAHDRGVVHRDVKPENVLLDKTGRVRVADFGLAKLMEHGATDRTLTDAGQVMGTPHYMAPEQVERPADVDHRADIYSLGVVFYEMLTGELPIGRFAAPSGKCDVDARIDEIVMRTLEKERDARYQQVSQVKTDVGAASGGSSAGRSDRRAERNVDKAVPAVARPSRVVEWIAAFVLIDCAVACWLAWDKDLVVLATAIIVVLMFGLVGLRQHHIGPDAGKLYARDRRRRMIAYSALSAVFVGAAVWAAVVGGTYELRDRLIVVNVLGTSGLLLVAFVRGWNPWVLLVWFAFVSSPVAFATAFFVPTILPPEALFVVVSENGAVIDFQRSDRLQIAAQWRSVQRLGPTATFQDALALCDRNRRGTLLFMSAADRAQKARAGEIGLPLLPADRLPKPLAEFRIERVQLSSTRTTWSLSSTVTATDGKTVIRFPMTRTDGAWEFGVGPVELK